MEETNLIANKTPAARPQQRNNLPTTDNTTDDRLSSLPDFLLANILSRLPHLRSAATTSVLSHRWRHLWTQVDRLRFAIGTSQSPDNCKDFNNLFTYIDHILRQLTSPNLRIFQLQSPEPQTGEETVRCAFYFASWVPQICSQNPEEFEVTLGKTETFIPLNFSCVFQCQSLVKLKLVGRFSCTVPIDRISICLPNLKELTMEFLIIEFGLLEKLIKSCPRLEILNLALESPYGDMTHISAQNLVYLSINVIEKCNIRGIAVDAPKLKTIRLEGEFTHYVFIREPSELLEANLGLFNYAYGPYMGFNHAVAVSALLKGVLNVGQLHLHAYNLEMFNACIGSQPDVLQAFRNLTSLKLYYIWMTPQDGRKPPFPACLLARVECIELIGHKVDRNGLNLIEYILSNAIVLKELRVGVELYTGFSEHYEKNHMWREYKFCKGLFELPRSSSTCEIEFEGRFIHSSSNDYNEDGSISCRITYATD